MSLMFLIRGIFIIQSLENKGVQRFIRDRWRRLFIPFVIGVTILMPLAYYPAYLLAHGRDGLHGGTGLPGMSGLLGVNELLGGIGWPSVWRLRAHLVDCLTVPA